VDIIKIKTRARTGQGKKEARRTRISGWIPAVCYSHGQPAQKIEVEARDFGALARARKTTHLLDLQLEGAESLAVIKELQRDVLRPENFLHIDFQKVSMNEKITVAIPVEVSGVPIGVRENGGILEHPIRRVMVRCFPMDMPEKIVIDVSELDINDSLHVRDLKVEKFEIVDSPEEVLAVVSIPAKEEAVVAATEVVAEGAEGAAPVDGAAPAEGAAPAKGAAPGAKSEGAAGAAPKAAAKPEKADKKAGK
jgi:large subunit ribosomal protein L25